MENERSLRVVFMQLMEMEQRMIPILLIRALSISNFLTVWGLGVYVLCICRKINTIYFPKCHFDSVVRHDVSKDRERMGVENAV